MVIDAFSVAMTYALIVVMFTLLGISVNFQSVFMILPTIIFIKLLIFYIFGLYHMVLKHAGFEDMIRIAILVILTNAAFFIFFMVVDNEFIHPIAFIFIGALEIGLIAFPRIISRIVNHLRYNLFSSRSNSKRTLIIGAGNGGEHVLKEIYKNKVMINFPVAFVDDDPEKIGSRFQGIQVVGPIRKITYFIDQFEIDEVIIAIANIKQKSLQSLIEEIASKEVTIKRLPLMSEIDKSGTKTVVDVKVEDLLNRSEISLDNEGIFDLIKDETVLITGGGGSIGSELARQVASMEPKQLIIFDMYENNAYDIQQELIRKFSKQKLSLKVIIGSVYHKKTLEEVFHKYKPSIIFHAAAYKHVPLMEDAPKEAIRTNILGTLNAADLAKKYKAKKFVLVSSDKAVRPTNIMGATKRYAELILNQLSTADSPTKFSSVRFGNVLGSNGSVIPLFKKQLESGGPLTVTHPDITRYFMTIPEAVSLILQSAVYAQGGELFVLDMGEPVKIKDLAEKMIKLSGFQPHRDIEIKYTGLRPGEKLYEELLVEPNDNKLKTPNEKIFVERDNLNDDSIDTYDLLNNYENESLKAVKTLMAQSIKSYKAT